MPVIAGQARNDLYVISQRNLPDSLDAGNWSIMNSEFKLYNNNLYNLKLDPTERNPIQNESLQKIMEEIALKFLKEIRPPEDQIEERERFQEQLKALGYIK